MNFDSCKTMLKYPVSLPCGCLICKQHLYTDKSKTTKFLDCENEEFSPAKRFKSSEMTMKRKFFEEENLENVSDDQKETRRLFNQMKDGLEKVFELFNLNSCSLEIEIENNFEEMKSKIDMQRNELKDQIDTIALAMIGQVSQRKQCLNEKSSQQNENVTNPTNKLKSDTVNIKREPIEESRSNTISSSLVEFELDLKPNVCK